MIQRLRAFGVLLAIGVVGASCAQTQLAPAGASTFHGIELPPPRPLKGFPSDLQLPPVWLLVDTTAVLATPGTFEYNGASAIAPAPWLITDIATTTVPAQQPFHCVIDSRTVVAAQAYTSVWRHAADGGDEEDTDQLELQTAQDGQFTVITLEPLASTRDQLLVIKVTLREGVVDYLWRLHPGQ